MKKNSYSIIETSCLSSFSYKIFENTNKDEQFSVNSEDNFNTLGHIGELIDINPNCWCSGKIGMVQLIMYGQHLSMAETYTKSNIPLCSKQIVVMTAKKVLLGKLLRNGGCCQNNIIDIKDREEKIIFSIRSQKCQAGQWIPKCFSWILCQKPVTYDIVDQNKQVVGQIQIFSDSCCSSKRRYEIKLPLKGDSISKMLIMNSIPLLH